MTKNVLFLCTGNSARSVLAEALMNHLGAPDYKGFSAGSRPTGVINPFTLRCLERHGLPTEGYRSKSWDEFASASAPEINLVVTVCDNAAAETCPVWPGHPEQVHWEYPDPATVEGSDIEKDQAFEEVFAMIHGRIEAFLADSQV